MPESKEHKKQLKSDKCTCSYKRRSDIMCSPQPHTDTWTRRRPCRNCMVVCVLVAITTSTRSRLYQVRELNPSLFPSSALLIPDLSATRPRGRTRIRSRGHPAAGSTLGG